MSISMSILPVLAADNPLSHVVDHPIIETDGGWWLLTNHMIMIIGAAVLMLIIFPLITKRYRSGEHIPTGTRNFFEAIMVFVRDDVARPVLGEHTLRFLPFLWTLFFFILFMNLLGLLPLDAIQNGIHAMVAGEPAHAEVIGDAHSEFHAIYGTATANLYVTATLAIFSFLLWNISGIRANGIGTWLHHFLGGAPWYMAIIIVPVEILGMFVKPGALAIRLFANMTAGHILVAVLVSFVGMAGAALGPGGAVAVGIPVVLGTVAIMCLELFVALLQAYIFCFLTALFIGQMVVHEHDESHEAHKHDEFGEVGDMTDYREIPEAAREAGVHMAG